MWLDRVCKRRDQEWVRDGSYAGQQLFGECGVVFVGSVHAQSFETDTESRPAREDEKDRDQDLEIPIDETGGGCDQESQADYFEIFQKSSGLRDLSKGLGKTSSLRDLKSNAIKKYFFKTIKWMGVFWKRSF